MGRLMPTLLTRVELFADAMVAVSERLACDRRCFRIVDQIAACGSSVGANTFEADEALSRADFAKTIGIVVKELCECLFWIRLCVRRQWIAVTDANPILSEISELKRIFGAILSRTRRAGIAKKRALPAPPYPSH